MIKEKDNIRKLVVPFNHNHIFLSEVYETNDQINNYKLQIEKTNINSKSYNQIRNESIEIFDTEDENYLEKMKALRKLINELHD